MRSSELDDRICLYYYFCTATSGLQLGDNDLSVDALFQFCYMGDDTHQAVAFGESRQGGIGLT